MNKFAFEKICKDLSRVITKNIVNEYKKNKKINYINHVVVDTLMIREETTIILCNDGYIDGNFTIDNLVANDNLLKFIVMLYDNAIQFDGDLIMNNILKKKYVEYKSIPIFIFLYEKKLIHNYEFIYESVPNIEILEIVDNIVMIDYNRLLRSSINNMVKHYHIEYNYILNKVSDVSDININDFINIHDLDSSLINILIEKGLNINIIKPCVLYTKTYLIFNDISDNYIGYINEVHTSTYGYTLILLNVEVNKLNLLLNSAKFIINDSLSWVMPYDRKNLFEKYSIDTNDIIMSLNQK